MILEADYLDFKRATSATSRCVIVTDYTRHDNPIVFVNPAFTTLTGYASNEALGRNARFMQGVDTDRTIVAQFKTALDAGISVRAEILNYRKNGEAFWNDVAIDPIRNARGTVIGFISIQFDVSARHNIESSLMEAERRLKLIDSNVPGFLYQHVLKADGTVELRYLSPSLNGILDIASEQPIASDDFYGFVHPDDRESLMRATQSSAADLSMFREEYRLVSPNQDVHWFRSNALPRRLPNGDTIWDGMAVDITVEKTSATQLEFLASHDPLTDLGNRQTFREEVATAIGLAAPGEQTGVIYVDLDEFQVLNDTFGQTYGDKALHRIGLRLSGFAQSRCGTAARLGGDEFAVLLPGLLPPASITELAETLCGQLAQAMTINQRETIIQSCAGVALFPDPHNPYSTMDNDPGAELVKRANLALAAAKRDGAGTCRAYSSEVDDRFRNRTQLRQALQRAIKEEQFVLHYQPLVELSTGKIVGAEALVRWYHPELGMQRPDLFIPLAESSGLIVPLGAWVMKAAMRQAQLWRRRGLHTPQISINVSSIQLQRPGFIEMVEQALMETGASPHDFDVELTESVLIDGAIDIHLQLNKLRSLGFGLVIDDFGTGHATFRYLHDFHVDKIKIDQSFVRHLVIESSDAAIIRSMITLSQSLKLGVVAEGIETAMQRDFLVNEGCMVGQGYLFSMPLTAEDFAWLLEKRVTLPMPATDND